MSDPDSYSTYGAPSEPRSNKPGSMVGDRIRGVARVFHGIGETIRGSTMSVVDNILSNKARGTEENGEITRRGRAEIQRGMAEVRGKNRSGTNPTSPTPSTAHDASLDQPGSDTGKRTG